MISKRGVLSGVLAVGLGVALTACGGSDAATPAGTTPVATSGPATASSSAAPATTDAAHPAVAVTVKGRKITPSLGRVNVPKGGTLTLTVTTDHDDELHLHGPDQELELKANVPGTIEATYDTAGIYEAELHDPSLLLFQVVVR